MTDFPDFDGTQNCAQPGVDAEQFFPHQNGSGARARRICNSDGKGNRCPFLLECRDYAITHSVGGVWGAWSDEERRAERKRRGIIPIPLAFGDLSGRDIRTDVVRVHGNHAGIKQHIAAGEPACDECATFRREDRRERDARNRKKAS